MNANFMTWEAAVQWLKAQPEQQDLVRACYYDEPLLEAARRYSRSEEWQAVQRLAQNWLPGRVLDLGAGNGIASYAFAQAGCQVTALEPNGSAIVGAGAIAHLAATTHLPIQVVQAAAETLPFPAASFDLVHGRQVLHHAADLAQLCREAARVLRPGGLFIATREHVISHRADLQTFLSHHPLHHLYGGENALRLRDYTRAIRQAGLRVQHQFGPHESVINYAPVTQAEYRDRVVARLQPYLGNSLATALVRRSPLLMALSRWQTWRDPTPGRLYSFVAVKR